MNRLQSRPRYRKPCLNGKVPHALLAVAAILAPGSSSGSAETSSGSAWKLDCTESSSPLLGGSWNSANVKFAKELVLDCKGGPSASPDSKLGRWNTAVNLFTHSLASSLELDPSNAMKLAKTMLSEPTLELAIRHLEREAGKLIESDPKKFDGLTASEIVGLRLVCIVAMIKSFLAGQTGHSIHSAMTGREIFNVDFNKPVQAEVLDSYIHSLLVLQLVSESLSLPLATGKYEPMFKNAKEEAETIIGQLQMSDTMKCKGPAVEFGECPFNIQVETKGVETKST